MWGRFNYSEIRRGLFTPEECVRITALADGQPGDSGHLARARECRLFWVYSTWGTAWIFERIGSAVHAWNGDYGFDLNPEQNAGLQLSRYESGERYDWHMDIGAGEASLRKISVVVELANPEDHGGGFEVFYGERGDNRLFLRQGDAAIFPSWIMHRAATPTRGLRWTLAAWIKGPEPFK